MINPFVVKKWAALILVGMLTTISFFIGLQFYGLLYALGTMFCGLIVSLICGVLLLKNPFSAMLEGKGLLVFNLDSTGIIRPSIVGLQPPYITGKVGKNKITDVFDRNAVVQFAAPNYQKPRKKYWLFGKTLPPKDKAQRIVEGEKAGGLRVDISETDYNDARFQMFQYPCLIYNSFLKSFLTKDFFSKEEKSMFTEHTILYLNRKTEDLTAILRDFGRYVVEMTKPQSNNIFANKWTWIIIAFFLVLLAVIFAPSIMSTIGFTGAKVGESIGQVGGSVVNPLG